MTNQEPALRVLYLEDNPVDADLTQATLLRLAPQMRFEVVPTLRVARQLLAGGTSSYDIVLSDLNLLDGSGFELLAHIRDHDFPLPVVLVTGSGDQEAAVAALKAGADDYLVKKDDYLKHLPQVLSSALARFLAARQRQSRPLRVLYAEPGAFDADLTQRHIAQHCPHIRIDIVPSGVQILERFPERPSIIRPYDVVLLDYRLPGFDALEVVKELRQKRGLRIPIVLVTGHGSEDVAIQALRLGADDYLVKREGYLYRLAVVLENVHKQALLNESEARYRNLFSSQRDAIIVADHTRTIIDVNQPALRTIFGYETDEILGHSTALLYADRESFEQAGQEIFNLSDHPDGKLIEARYRKKSGEVFWAEVSAFKLRNDSGLTIGNIGVIRDISERKQTEVALRGSEAEYRRLSQEFNGLLDAIPDSIMLLDAELRVLWANRGAAETLAGTSQALVGRFCHELKYQRDKPCQACSVLRAIDTRRPQHVEVGAPGGRTWEVRTVPLMNEQGRIDRVIWLMRDVTEQKKLEQQYRHAQKMESIGTMAGGIAHDFNNILTAITGFVYVALLKAGPDSAVRGPIEQIQAAAARAASLTRELLLFSRRQPADYRPLDLNVLLERTRLFLERTLGADITLSSVPHATPLPVLAEAHQLQQVLMNLAVNARDAMPEGGSFSLETSPVSLSADFVAAHRYGRPGRYVLLSVSDNGQGMDKTVQAHIFEPFFTTKPVGQGTGLGLAVVYGIIKQHGGFINVYSEPGHGTTFRIYLPLQDEAAMSLAETDPAQGAGLGGSETILVAEDDAQVRSLVAQVLSEAGYRVILAVDGPEALQKFEQHAAAIDLLLFDLIMPKMNGKEVLDSIRQQRSELPVIFVSGYAPERMKQKVDLAPNAHLLHKPMAPDALLRKVRSVLDLRA